MSDFSFLTDFVQNPPSRRDITAYLDRTSLPADAKLILAKVLETTVEVAGKIIQIGQQILAFVVDLAKRFPGTAFGAIIGLTLATLIAGIPVLGLVLGPLVGPLILALAIGKGALADLKNHEIGAKIDVLTNRINAGIKNG